MRCVTVVLYLLPSQGYEVLSKCVALYAANLIKDNNTLKALDLFCRYGAPGKSSGNSTSLIYDPFHHNVNICRTLLGRSFFVKVSKFINVRIL